MIDITHIHPMLVHFPIVMLITGLVISNYLLFKGDDIADSKVCPDC